MRKYLLFLFCMIAFNFQYTHAYDFEMNGIYYNINYNNDPQSASVTFGTNPYSGAIIIPGTVSFNGRTLIIESIGNEAFKDCTNLNSIMLPNSITSIGSNAFENCINIKSINIPYNVTSIGSYAFHNCDNLISIELPKRLLLLLKSNF